MKKSYPGTLVLMIIALLSQHFKANAQTTTDTVSRDYVINLKGDTIKGQELNVTDGGVRIDPFTETHTVRYKATDIKEACKTGQVYTSVKIAATFRDVAMLKRVAHGAINVYEFYQQSNTGANQTTWYAGKDGIPAAEIKTSGIGGISRAERKNNLMKLIGDNADLVKEFDAKKDYSFDYLADIITRYNRAATGMKKSN